MIQNLKKIHLKQKSKSCHLSPTGSSSPSHARASVPPSVRRIAPYGVPCYGHGCGHAPGEGGQVLGVTWKKSEGGAMKPLALGFFWGIWGIDFFGYIVYLFMGKNEYTTYIQHVA